MKIFRPDESTIYDNLYSKPAQLGLPTNYRFSMSVLFFVDDCLYYGQYNFTTGTWTTLPGDDKCRQFKDREVQYWLYPPEALDLFKRYAEDVKAGRCSDEGRIDKYSLNFPNGVPTARSSIANLKSRYDLAKENEKGAT